MTDITDSREIIQEEETRFRSAVSEALLFKMGATNNFISNRQYDTHTWVLNGDYTKASGQAGFEGMFVAIFDMEIIAISLGNIVAGVSGTTTFDVHLIDGAGNDTGSIFTVQPSIDSTASNNTYAARDFVNSLDETATGVTLPTLPTRDFDKFDAFRIDVDAAMTSAENAFLAIHFRPR